MMVDLSFFLKISVPDMCIKSHVIKTLSLQKLKTKKNIKDLFQNLLKTDIPTVGSSLTTLIDDYY